MELRPLIASVDEQLLQRRIYPQPDCEQQDAAVAILDFGRMNYGMERQAERKQIGSVSNKAVSIGS
jgi:hypothetical protein